MFEWSDQGKNKTVKTEHTEKMAKDSEFKNVRPSYASGVWDHLFAL